MTSLFFSLALDQDSNCSWFSEPESVLNNWRGWRKQSTSQAPPLPSSSTSTLAGLTSAGSSALGLSSAVGGGAAGAHPSIPGTANGGSYGRDLGAVSLPSAFHRGELNFRRRWTCYLSCRDGLGSVVRSTRCRIQSPRDQSEVGTDL